MQCMMAGHAPTVNMFNVNLEVVCMPSIQSVKLLK